MPGLSLGLGLGLSRSQGGGFSLAAFMAGQSDGFWYDFTSPDRLFQSTVGPPANDPSEVIGLALDQRRASGKTLAQVAAEQPELFANNDFSGGSTGWNVINTGASHTATFSGGAVRYQTTTTSPALEVRQVGVLTVGKLYELTVEVSAHTSGSIKELAGAAAVASGVGTTVTYFVATTANCGLTRNSTNVDITIDRVSLKEIPSYAAAQATTNFKPKFQLVGATGDGSDDRLGTTYGSTTGDAFALYPATTVPATISATQVIAGAMDGSANGDYLAITTGGALRAKVGATTLDSTGVDLRNGVHDVGYWTDGATLYLYANGAIVASGAWTGSRPTTVWNLFALNNNGTASSFFAGSIRAALVGRQALTLSLANQLSAPY